MSKRWVWPAVAAVALAAGLWLLPGRGTAPDLPALLAELDATDPGWRLADLSRSRGEVKAEENGALRLEAVARAMPSRWSSARSVGTLKRSANARLSAEQRETLNGLLAGTPIAEARDLVRFPRGRVETPFRMVSGVGGRPDHVLILSVGKLLAFDAEARADGGEPDAALASARAGLNAVNAVRDDSTALAHLVRVALLETTLTGVERTLAVAVPSGEALGELERALPAGPSSLVAALRWDRARYHEMFLDIAAGRADPDVILGMFNELPLLLRWGGTPLRRDALRREHGSTLRLLTKMIDALQLPPAEQYGAIDAIERDRGPGLLSRVVWGQFAQLAARGREAAAHVAVMRAAIAAERHRLRHAAWPDAANGTDPIDGAPLRFRREPDGLTIYSVGDDRADDGGSGRDIAYRLWDPALRGVP